MSVKIRKNITCTKKIISICNPTTFSCGNGKYLASIHGDSVITCDKIKETTKTGPTNVKKKSNL